MTQLHGILLVLHIALGCAALVLFWVPLYTQKGQLNHKRFGRWYRNLMYSIAGTGAIMATLVIAMPLVIKHEYAKLENAAIIADNLRYFWVFLLYLALVSYTSTKHGDKVLKVKEQRHLLRTPSYVLPIILLSVGGFGLAIMGFARGTTLHIVFGILGIFISFSMLRYIYKSQVKKCAYIIEHISSMLGSGIGAYTAFLSFGGRQLLENAGSYQLIFWIAPGVVGSILSYWLCKKYGKIFRVETVL